MRFSLIGPVYPYRGGIAHHTALLARHLAERHAVQVISFSRQYPRWLRSGRSDRDPSESPLRVEAEFLLDSLNPATWWQVAGRVAQWGTEVLILPWWVTFWGPHWYVISRLTHRRTPARILFLCHNVLPHEAGLLDRWIARITLAQGDAFLAQCAEQAELLRRLVPGKPVAWTALPTFAEVGAERGARRPDGDRWGDSLQLAGRRPLLLFFGFVRPYKGLGVLLDALPLILAQLPAAHLVVAGEIWEGKGRYLSQIAHLGLAEHVTLMDAYVPDEQLRDLCELADVAVLPYLSATQSAVAALAIGFGLPVITTCVGGLADAIRDGQTGLLVPPGEPAALAQAVVRYHREKLGPAMRDAIRAESRFEWNTMVQAIETLVG